MRHNSFSKLPPRYWHQAAQMQTRLLRRAMTNPFFAMGVSYGMNWQRLIWWSNHRYEQPWELTVHYHF